MSAVSKWALVVPRYIGRNPLQQGEKNEIRGRRYAGIDRPENLVTPGAWLFPQSYASFIGFDHFSSLLICIVHHTHAIFQHTRGLLVDRPIPVGVSLRGRMARPWCKASVASRDSRNRKTRGWQCQFLKSDCQTKMVDGYPKMALYIL